VEKSSKTLLFCLHTKSAFSALTLLVGCQEGHLAGKKWGDGGGGHRLVWIEWRLAGWLSCLFLLIIPCSIKSRSFSSGTGSPGWSRKKGRKTVVVVVVHTESSNMKIVHTMHCGLC